MKKFFWLCGGYPNPDACAAITDAYMAGGCDGVEWAIPPEDPYREQAHLQPFFAIARKNCADPLRHLEQMAQFREKYPQAAVFPAVYQQTVLEVGATRLCDICLKSGIDTLFLVGSYEPDVFAELSARMKIATAVSYYMTDEELEKARRDTGFIYMQALPYQAELDAGYTRARLRECVQTLRAAGLTRPIYCAKGVKTPEDAAFVGESGADGFILGSAMLPYYDNLAALTEAVRAFPDEKAGDTV